MAEERPASGRVSEIRGFPSRTSHTLSALSGGAAVILAVVAFLLDIDRPTFDDVPAKFVAYYTDNQSQLQIALLLFMFSTFWFAWFLGLLRWLYEGAEQATRGLTRASPIAFAGGIAGLAVVAATGVAQLTAIETVGSIPPGMVRALDLFSQYGVVWGEVLLSVHLLSASFVIRVTQVLPEWIGGVCFVGAVLGFFQACLVLSPGQADSVFGFAGIVWFALFLVYILAASIHIARRADTALLAG
jgi:hypothetical protein